MLILGSSVLEGHFGLVCDLEVCPYVYHHIEVIPMTSSDVSVNQKPFLPFTREEVCVLGEHGVVFGLKHFINCLAGV